MYTSIADFEADWKRLSEGTAKVMAALTDDSLKWPVAENHRTLGRIAWHIVLTIPEMCNRTGLGVSGPDEHTPVPPTAKAIANTYNQVAEALLERIKTKWKDADLHTEVDLYGEKWKNGRTLRILIDHEIHHRGQMTVLMRQAGVRVPGIFGPAREDWANYGMPAPEI